MDTLSCLKLQELLLNKGLQDVATAVDNNEVTGQCLLELTEGEIKELAPKIGDRVKLSKLINECQSEYDLLPTLSSTEGSTISNSNETMTDINTEEEIPDDMPQYLSDSSGVPITPDAFTEDDDVLGDSLSLPNLVSNALEPSTSQAAGPSHSERTAPHNPSVNRAGHSNVPDKDKFGYTAAAAIEDGHLTSSAKRKIISLMRSLIIPHTLYPTAEQYVTVCAKLVEKHPKLRDMVGNGIGSWKISLRNSFKNYRRDHCPRTASKRTSSIDHHSSKKLKLTEEDHVVDHEEYEGSIELMQTLDLKRNRATGTKLMIETRSIRREWIARENPNIVEVMDRFPLLKDLQIFQAEYWNMVDRSREDAIAAWNAWKKTIIKVAEVESKRASIKKVLQNYKQVPEGLSQENDYRDFAACEILFKLLYLRNTKGLLYKQVLTADVDLGLEASIQLEPFFLIVGQIGSVECNYLLVAENEIILESKSFLEAIFDVMGTYFQ